MRIELCKIYILCTTASRHHNFNLSVVTRLDLLAYYGPDMAQASLYSTQRHGWYLTQIVDSFKHDGDNKVALSSFVRSISWFVFDLLCIQATWLSLAAHDQKESPCLISLKAYTSQLIGLGQ